MYKYISPLFWDFLPPYPLLWIFRSLRKYSCFFLSTYVSSQSIEPTLWASFSTLLNTDAFPSSHSWLASFLIYILWRGNVFIHTTSDQLCWEEFSQQHSWVCLIEMKPLPSLCPGLKLGSRLEFFLSVSPVSHSFNWLQGWKLRLNSCFCCFLQTSGSGWRAGLWTLLTEKLPEADPQALCLTLPLWGECAWVESFQDVLFSKSLLQAPGTLLCQPCLLFCPLLPSTMPSPWFPFLLLFLPLHRYVLSHSGEKLHFQWTRQKVLL